MSEELHYEQASHCLTYLEHGLTEILHGPSTLSGYLTLPPVFDMSLYNC